MIDGLRRLRPEDALSFFRSKGLAPPDARFDFRDVWQNAHATQFVVAKAMRTEVLEVIRAELDEALANGGTLRSFMDRLEPELKRLGWWGEGTERDPLTGEMKAVRLGSPRRLEIIFQANMRAAHAAGKWARIERVKDAFPFLRYVQIQRDTKREGHEPYHNLILPVDHPAWERIYPPNGWRCGCTVQQLSQAQLDRRGLRVREGFEIEERPVLNRRTDRIEQIARGVDPAWDGNPGKAWAGMRRRTPPGPPPTQGGYGAIDDPDAFVRSDPAAGFGMESAFESADAATREAAIFYQDDDGYKRINRALRGLSPTPDFVAEVRDDLDRAIADSVVPTGTMLYRGQRRVPRLTIGDELTDLAFQSFSRSPAMAVRFAGYGEPFPPDQPNLPGLGLANVLLRYRSSAGQRGLSLGDAEFEVVLPRAQPFRVLEEQVITFAHPDTGDVHHLVIYDIGRPDET